MLSHIYSRKQWTREFLPLLMCDTAYDISWNMLFLQITMKQLFDIVHMLSIGLLHRKKTCVTCLIYYHTFTFGQFILQGSPYTYQTRSTPKAQTSATPSLKSVKQSTQAWNIVAYCFLCPYPENVMNVHLFGIPWCCQPTRTQKIEKGTLCPRG